MALLNLLIPIFYITFFLGELPRFRIFEAVTIGPIDLIVFSIFIFWVFKIKKSKNYFLEKPIIIFITVAFFSLALNFFSYTKTQLLISFMYLFRWMLYSTMYFVVRDLGKMQEKKFFNLSTITAGLLIVVGLFQFIFFPNLISLYHLGWDKHLNRLFSTFLDPNFTGVLFVMFFVFIFHFREKIFKTNKKFEFTFLIISFISIVLTYSRGALLMFAVSAIAYAFLTKNKKIFFSALFVLISTFLILIPGFYLENTNLLRTVSTTERIGTAVKAIKIFKDHPLGVGFDAYRYAREKYGEMDFQLAGPSHSGAGLDNSFIFVLVTAGVLGLFSYLYLIKKMFLLGLRKRNNYYGFVLVISLAGIVVNSLTINSLFYSFIMLWVWIIAGLTESN